jgi:small-conductance mechanosensitive channel
MKTLAYSEVPRTPNYVHLAYLSASAQRLAGNAVLGVGMILTACALCALLVRSQIKMDGKPSRWKWPVALVLAALTILALVLGYMLFANSGPYPNPTLRAVE